MERVDFLRLEQDKKDTFLSGLTIDQKEVLMERWHPPLYDFVQAHPELKEDIANSFIHTFTLSKDLFDAIETYMHDNDASDLADAANKIAEDNAEEVAAEVRFYMDYKFLKSMFVPTKKLSPYFKNVMDMCTEEARNMCLDVSVKLNRDLLVAMDTVRTTAPPRSRSLLLYSGVRLAVPNTGKYASRIPGEEMSVDAYLSTSLKLEVARSFCRIGVILVIEVGPEIPILIIGEGRECEVLFPPGTIMTRGFTKPLNEQISEDKDVIFLHFKITRVPDVERSIAKLEENKRIMQGTIAEYLRMKEPGQAESPRGRAVQPEKRGPFQSPGKRALIQRTNPQWNGVQTPQSIRVSGPTPTPVLTELKGLYGSDLIRVEHVDTSFLQDWIKNPDYQYTKQSSFGEDLAEEDVEDENEQIMEKEEELFEKGMVVDRDRKPFSIYSEEYQEMAKEILKIFYGMVDARTTKSNKGLRGCRWSSLFYYLIFLIYEYGIPLEEAMDILHEFMDRIFDRQIGFKYEEKPQLRLLQHVYTFNFLPLEKDEHKRIRSWENMVELFADKPNGVPLIFLMGISRTEDGIDYVKHYFNLIVFKAGDTYRMFMISSYGSSYVSIHQYATEITEKEFRELIVDVETPMDIPIHPGEIKVVDTKRGPKQFSIQTPSLRKAVEESQMCRLFLKPEFGMSKLVDKRNLDFKITLRERYVLIDSFTGSDIEYWTYKKQRPPGCLVVFTTVPSIMEREFREMVGERYTKKSPDVKVFEYMTRGAVGQLLKGATAGGKRKRKTRKLKLATRRKGVHHGAKTVRRRKK
jgi:hypothetical protein